jgi:tight adherence protein B
MDILNMKASPEYTLGLIGVFLGVSLLITGAFQLIIKPLLHRLKINRRINKGRNQHLAQVHILKNVQGVEDSLFDAIAKRIGAVGKIENLERTLLQADIYWRPGTFLGVTVLSALLGFMALFLYSGFYPGLSAAVFFGYAPFLILHMKKGRKTRVIEKQMPEAMELLARSLRAGHAMPSSIELAGKEIPDPLGGEMKTVYDEQRLGLGLNAALQRMGERVASQDLHYFVTAVVLQAETGGNLAEVMENIGYLIRERLKLKGKIQALSAEGRLSALILTLLPFFVFGTLLVISPRYLDPLLYNPSGQMIIGVALFNIIVGLLWMRKIININV